jgi:hypothetical protein
MVKTAPVQYHFGTEEACRDITQLFLSSGASSVDKVLADPAERESVWVTG